MRRVLRLAIERQADPARLPRTWLLPHRTQGVPCPRRACTGRIRQIRKAGRTAYFCPSCPA